MASYILRMNVRDQYVGAEPGVRLSRMVVILGWGS